MSSMISGRDVFNVTTDILDILADAGNASQHMLVNSTESSGVTAQDDVTTQNDVTSRDRLIPDGLMLYVTMYLSIVIPIVISAFGTGTNVINLIIFTKLGVKDSMTVGLWALSLSDLLVAVQTLGSSVCYLANITSPSRFMNPILIQYVSLCWSQDLMYLVSNWITTFISLERCYCVINPFKVRATFTRNRSIAAVVFIYAFHIGSYLPIFATHRLDWASEDASNFSNFSTVMVVSYGPNRATIHHAVDILNGAVLPVIQQALVIGSAVCLSYGLKSSSKVRKQKQGDDVKRRSMLSQKESRLVTVVVFLALILTVCNTPRLVRRCVFVLLQFVLL